VENFMQSPFPIKNISLSRHCSESIGVIIKIGSLFQFLTLSQQQINFCLYFISFNLSLIQYRKSKERGRRSGEKSQGKL